LILNEQDIVGKNLTKTPKIVQITGFPPLGNHQKEKIPALTACILFRGHIQYIR
jgi:hypothetical protein